MQRGLRPQIDSQFLMQSQQFPNNQMARSRSDFREQARLQRPHTQSPIPQEINPNMFNNSSAQSGFNFNQAQQPAPYINPFDMTAPRPPSASGSEFHFGSPAQQPNLMNQLG